MTNKYQERIQNLYLDGVVQFQNFFDEEYLSEVSKAKKRLFEQFPYGQYDDLKKIPNKDLYVREGGHMIWDIAHREPIFKKILDNKIIKSVATQVLGDNYKISSFYIRKTPKTDNILNTHIDYQGGLSFSILLDEIKNENEGETFYYKKSHKYPPPPFSKFESPNLKKDMISTIGKVGDVFFWFPDCWHGRNANKNDFETTILICHMGNQNIPEVNIGYGQKNSNESKRKNNSILNRVFKFCGDSPENIITHLIYCLFYFKLNKISTIAIKEQLPYTRKKFGDINIDSFSIVKYVQVLKFTKLIKILVSKLLRLILGDKIFSKLKNRLKKYIVTY